MRSCIRWKKWLIRVRRLKASVAHATASRHRAVLGILGGISLLLTVNCCSLAADDDDESWATIVSAFECPTEFAGQFGDLRPLLKFDNGAALHSAEDWAQRRQEILTYWREKLGPWPPPIEHPRVDVLSSSRSMGVTRRQVRVEIGPDQFGVGWLLEPDGEKPRPAVVVVYYEPDTSIGLGRAEQRHFGALLAERGFVTLSIGTPGGDAWHPQLAGATCQPLAYHAYVGANLWRALADWPDIDAERIGIVGHSYGGKWAMFAACLFENYACGAWSDPGIQFDETRPNINYWEPWYLGLDRGANPREPGLPTEQNPRTGAYAQLVAEGHDLHELQALMAPRPFLVSAGSEDPPERWMVLNHCIAVNRLLGYEHRVGMTSRGGHDPTVESNRAICAFFKHFLADPTANHAHESPGK